MAILSVLSLGFVSCDDDDDDVKAPVIELEEVGHDNSYTAHPGHDMHLAACLKAEGLIKFIHIEIAQKDGTYVITKKYEEGSYVGIRNAEFHEHIDIPEEAPLGEYQLSFIVADKEDRTTVANCKLTLTEYDGEDDDDDEVEHEHEHKH